MGAAEAMLGAIRGTKADCTRTTMDNVWDGPRWMEVAEQVDWADAVRARRVSAATRARRRVGKRDGPIFACLWG